MHKKDVAAVAKDYVALGFELIATSGTAAILEKAGLKVEKIYKVSEGRPNAVDLLKNKEIQLVINTPAGQVPRADEVKIRTAAMQNRIPIMTTLRGADAALRAIKSLQGSEVQVRALQEYHK